MKLFAILIAVYFTVLSLVPCADGVLQKTDPSDIEALTTEHDHNNSEHQDNCTLFCVCACCGSVVTLPTIQTLEESKLEISTDYLFHYTFDYSFDYKEGVWHPPSFG